MDHIKKEYGELAKKYKLPNWKELDNEFELLYFSNLIEIPYVLRFVRRRINDKLSNTIGLLQGLLQPNPGSLINLEESNFLDDNDRKKTSSLIRELMNMERRSALLDINFDEKKDAEFIKDAVKGWFEFKKEVYNILSKIKKGWEQKVKEESREHYFG